MSPPGDPVSFADPGVRGTGIDLPLLLRWAAAVVVGATLPLCGVRAGVAVPANPGRIVFVRNGDIWTIRADGRDLHRLTTTPSEESFPDWSPDGSRIVFSRRVGGRDQLFVMRADGSGVERLLRRKEDDYGPAWSPDGREIAFSASNSASERSCGLFCSSVLIVEVASRKVREVSSASDDAGCPDWLPDGKHIGFGSAGFGVVDRDGNDLKTLIAVADYACPKWSPDGRLIAYLHLNTAAGIWVMRADTTHRKLIVPDNESLAPDDPAWSPEGSQLVYDQAVSLGSAHRRLYIINRDGTGKRFLTDGRWPSWTPY